MYSPLLACIAVFVFFPLFRDKTVTILRALIGYILGISILGLIGAVAGYSIGVSIFCSGENPGAQCGLGGVFISAPFGFSLGVVGFLIFWARKSSHSNKSLKNGTREELRAP